MEQNFVLEIAKLIGEPINKQLPIPVELGAIADTYTVEAGEHAWRYSALDGTPDVCLAVDATNGAITVKKRDPLGDVEMTFSGLNSKLEYVLVNTVLGSPDTDVLSRRKESITRAMDKTEIKTILDAILAGSDSTKFPAEYCEEITPASGDDLYDLIMAMKHAVEDWGDGYVMLVGTAVKEAIDLYDKVKASTFYYNVTLTQKLRELGIEVIKVFGKVSNASNEAESDLLNTNKIIMVAKDSRVAKGKPVAFVRRRIAPAIAKLMGAEVTDAERAIVVNPTPVNVAGTNTLAYGVYGYESTIFAITNPTAIKYADATTVI